MFSLPDRGLSTYLAFWRSGFWFHWFFSVVSLFSISLFCTIIFTLCLIHYLFLHPSKTTKIIVLVLSFCCNLNSLVLSRHYFSHFDNFFSFFLCINFLCCILLTIVIFYFCDLISSLTHELFINCLIFSCFKAFLILFCFLFIFSTVKIREYALQVLFLWNILRLIY